MDVKPKKAYKELTLEEKVALIKQAQSNPHCSQATLARQYGIAKSNACRILKRRQEYLSAYASACFGSDRKRKMRDIDTKELDTRVKSWIETRLGQGVPVSGTQIQQVANKIGSQLGLTNFNANKVWLNNFSKAYFECPSDLTEFDVIDEENSGNETLRAHMYKQHSISRMFMCRCCNWAFPDKTSLHMHMQAMATGNPGNVSIIAKSSASPNPTQPQQDSSPHLLSALSLSLSNSLLCMPNMSMQSREHLMHRLKERAILSGAAQAAAQAGVGLATWLSHLPKIPTSTEHAVLPLCEEEHDESEDNNTMVVVGTSSSPTSSHSPTEMAKMIIDEEVDVEHAEDRDTKPDLAALQEMMNANANHSCTSDPSVVESKDGNDDYEPPCKRPASQDVPLHVSSCNSGVGSFSSPTETHSFTSNSNSSPSSHGSPKHNDLGGILPPSLPPHPFAFPFGHQTHSLNSMLNCFACQILRGKLGLSENRNRFLEAKVTSLESKVGRLESRIATLDGNSRRYEFEGKALRSQGEILQRKLLDCQEQAVTFLQQSRDQNPTVQKFVTDVLQSTYLASQ